MLPLLLLWKTIKKMKKAEREAQAKKSRTQQHSSGSNLSSKQSVPVKEESAGVVVRRSRKRTSGWTWKSVDRFIFFIIVFVMPCAYGLYVHLDRLLFQEKTTQTEAYYFPPMSLDFDKLQAERIKGMRKWNFTYSLHGIDRRANLSLEEFYDVYDGKWPVIITDCIPTWPAYKKWTKDFFKSNYGDDMVSMAATNKGTLDALETFALPMGLYLDHLGDSSPHGWTYLSDELFIPHRPELAADIAVCPVLQEDFFPLFPADVRPWWSFLLWGTAYSRSKLHIDPYNWTGTNAVLQGAKRWKLLPPGQDHLLYVFHNVSSNFPLDCPKYNSPVDTYDYNSLQKYPLTQEARILEFVQQPGELLMIPTGWFHQAFNEKPTLAVSGQLMNRNSYRMVLEEAFKGNSLPRGPYPNDLPQWSPEKQVQYVLQGVSQEILQRGRDSTRFIQSQLDEAARRKKEAEVKRNRPSKEL